MRQRKRVEWSRLDNASKIFPAACNNLDTKVFRLSCELYEDVNPAILQEALDLTMETFPLYKSVLRRGVFWYYFQTSDIHPQVTLESHPVCAPIYVRDKRNLLFRVFYYHSRINLEVFHALADGTGALWFLQTLIYHYLTRRYKDTYAGQPTSLDNIASLSKKMDDSFGRHFPGTDHLTSVVNPNIIENIIEKKSQAFHIKGSRLDENKMKVIEGCLSAKAVLEEAHRYNTTLTIFVASLFIYSIYQEMPARSRKRPIVLSVPINLRQYFESKTARNFFATINVSFHPGQGTVNLEAIISKIRGDFQNELRQERLLEHLNRLMSLEKNAFARIVPLPLKDYSLRLANKINDRRLTASISNLGRISMPGEFEAYIRQFSLCTSARRPQITMCSYGDKLVVTFTSPFRETEIQQTFFEFLAKKGIEIEITSNL